MLQLQNRQCWNFVKQPLFCSPSLCNFQNSQTTSKVLRTSQEFSIFFSWDMTPCTIAKNILVYNFLPHSLFTFYKLNLGAADFPKHLQIYTRLHGLTSKKTLFLIVTTYRTSNITVCRLVYRHSGNQLWDTKIFSVWRFM